MEDLRELLNKHIGDCMEERDGRFYPTEEGCARLKRILLSYGYSVRVSIDENNQFDIKPINTQ